jgi:hypothetical protein
MSASFYAQVGPCRPGNRTEESGIVAREATQLFSRTFSPRAAHALTATELALALQFKLNGGRPVGSSIPATEHSVMTSWPSEAAAMLNMIEHFGEGTYAIVMDSYDYAKASGVK